MLEAIHKYMNGIMWTIVILITVAFLFFGIYPADIGHRAVAKVGGDVISTDELNRVYQGLVDNYRQLLKDKFEESMTKTLRSEALQELIANKLYVQEADRIGLSVSDEELQDYIKNTPAFNRSGRFDRRIYNDVLSRINMTPAAYEANQREYILRLKLERIVRDGVMITESELAAAYNQRNPEAKPGDFEKNKETFRQTYLAEKQRDALTAFIKGIQDRTEITINNQSLAS